MSLPPRLHSLHEQALKTAQEREDWAAKILAAYYAMRHHPVFRPAGLDASLAHDSFSVAVATPLENENCWSVWLGMR